MSVRLLIGDCRERLRDLPDASVQCVVTSPPYFGLRDYGVDGQMGTEPTPQEFVAAIVEVFREVRRVLRNDGTVWLNLGDSYNAYNGNRGPAAGANKNHHKVMPALPTGSGLTVSALKNKDLIGIPWRVAFALQEEGWYLRQDIIWSKPNPMPESVRDRCTKAHEYLFLLTKSPRYYYDQEAIKEPDKGVDHRRNVTDGQKSLEPSGGLKSPHRGIRTVNGRNGQGRNKRSVWHIATRPYPGAHFATFPPALVEPCILAGTTVGDTVLDPFAGSGTTAYVADYLNRDAVLIDLNAEYADLIRERLESGGTLFSDLEVVP